MLCLLNFKCHLPVFLLWFHSDKMIDFKMPYLSGMSVLKMKRGNDTFWGKLMITDLVFLA